MCIRDSPWQRPSPSPWQRPSPSPWQRPSPSPWQRPSPSPWAAAVAEPVAEAVAEPVAQAAPAVVSPEHLADAPEAEEPEVPLPAPAARPEPSTMEELLAEQDTEIRSFKHGDVVEGAIVRIDKDEILVDIGAKSEGVVSNREDWR